MFSPDNKKNNPQAHREEPLTGDDLEMIQELDYEEKKRNRPYDPYERHWDEA
ncbi:MAG: hypothetical protein K6E11_00265 [Bacilli bacterium]|nr:hypothetical protein [Bacilli bacterium]